METSTWIREQKQNNLKKTEWIKLNEGANSLRLFGDLYSAKRIQFSKTAFLVVPTSLKVNAPESLQIGYVFYCGAIDRRDNQAKMFQFGAQIQKHVQALVSDSDWGPVENYDVNILKNSKASVDSYYTVTPKAPKALSASDLAQIAEFDTDYLQKCANPDMEHINKRLADLGYAEAVTFTTI